MNRSRVLILCTGNSARSQMAEAFLKKYASELFEVYSAGLEPKGMNPYTVQVMEEAGCSLEGQYSKNITEYMGKITFKYLITVCDDAEQKCPCIFPGVHQRLHWSFEDPAAFEGTYGEKLAQFRRVRDQIEDKILSWLAEYKPVPAVS